MVFSVHELPCANRYNHDGIDGIKLSCFSFLSLTIVNTTAAITPVCVMYVILTNRVEDILLTRRVPLN